MSKTQVNFWIEMALFAALVLMALPEATGLTVHQGIGIGLGAGLAIHAALHWSWITTITRRWAKNLPRVTRRNAVIDALLLLTFTCTLASGIGIAPLLRDDPAPDPLIALHHIAAVLTFLLLSVHLILHRKWIGHGIKRYVLGVYTFGPTPARKAGQK